MLMSHFLLRYDQRSRHDWRLEECRDERERSERTNDKHQYNVDSSIVSNRFLLFTHTTIFKCEHSIDYEEMRACVCAHVYYMDIH